MSEFIKSEDATKVLVSGNIVTPRELSQMVRLSEATIRNLASHGQLPGFKIGDSWRFDLDEILKLIKGNSRGKKW